MRNDFENINGTWAFTLKKNWDQFNDVLDMIKDSEEFDEKTDLLEIKCFVIERGKTSTYQSTWSFGKGYQNTWEYQIGQDKPIS